MTASYLDVIVYAVAMISILIIYLPFSPMTIDLVNFSRDTQLWIYKNRHILWVVGVLCFAVLLARSITGHAGEAWLWTSIISIAVLAFMFWSGYVPYVMTPPSDPKLLSTDEADKIIGDDEVVIGLEIGGEIRAYPRDSIARPHFYPDVVGNTPVTVSYCILCNSGMAFKNEIAGKPMNLGCITAYNNNIIYKDKDTGNFIQQLDGKVIDGPDEGEELEFLPTVIATWGEWKKLHPDTKLYYAPAKSLRDKMVGQMLKMMIPIDKLARRSKPWHRIQGVLDNRLPAMSFVLGVEINGEACAYSISALTKSPVRNDTVGGEAIAVMYDSNRDIGHIFSREVNDTILTFENASEAGDGLVAKDRETGTLWDITGNGMEGELVGKKLTAIPHYNKIFWFSWALFKQNTKVKTESQVV